MGKENPEAVAFRMRREELIGFIFRGPRRTKEED